MFCGGLCVVCVVDACWVMYVVFGFVCVACSGLRVCLVVCSVLCMLSDERRQMNVMCGVLRLACRVLCIMHCMLLGEFFV